MNIFIIQRLTFMWLNTTAMNTVKLTRLELYNLVWTESMLSLSKKYAISDVGLRKKCVKMDIPLPGNGFWAKKKFNKRIAIKKLPENYTGEKTTELKLREDELTEVSSERRMLNTRISEIENDTRISLIVPERLSKPDPVIEKTIEEIHKRQIWIKGNYNASYNNGETLNIVVNKNELSRALRFMDTLIKALRKRGHEFRAVYNEFRIFYEGQEFEIWLKEKMKRVVVQTEPWKSSELISTGLLIFRTKISYSTTEWLDGKKPLEDQISRIIAHIEIQGEKERDESIEREKQREIKKEKDRIAKELQERKEKELSDFKKIFLKAKRHDKAEKLRKYADKLLENAKDRNILTEKIKLEIEWIRKKADWYDPFVEADDELLREADRNELTFPKKFYNG